MSFLSLLGYELTYNQRAYEIDGQTFAISHGAGAEDTETRRRRDTEKDASLRVSASPLSPSEGERVGERGPSRSQALPRLTPQQFYRQLFRLVYRFLFLLVSEDRGLISPNPVYRDHYGIARLRRMLDVPAAWTDHPDLWLSLRTLFHLFQDDKLAAVLTLAPLNGELFATQTLDGCTLSNHDLLHAFWHLAYYKERESAPARRVNYAALDVEELGSVYESLLEFHPDITHHESRFTFDLIFGSERKTTGSFYTPPELVNELIESALVPVIAKRLECVQLAGAVEGRGAAGKREQAPRTPNAGARSVAASAEYALLSLKIIDVACGSGHMLLAAARRVGKELARLRTGEDEPAPERVREAIRDVISHCIYGVDRNPLAVDLCRVALWLESHTAGKPLTFLDHRIRCGDSLVGVFDVGVLAQGIPDTYSYLNQLPVLPPTFYQPTDVAYVASRVLELVYTANDMQPLADALRASTSPIAATVPATPYRWDEARRASLRAELDAWFARSYGLTRDELRYILDPADVHGPDFPAKPFACLRKRRPPNSANTAPAASCLKRGTGWRRHQPMDNDGSIWQVAAANG